MDHTIRAATPEDAEAVLSVARGSWHAAYDDILGEDAVEAVLEDWYQLGDLRASIGDSTFVVAEHDGTVVGFAHAGPNPDAGDCTYQLYRIYVRPDLWGRAIGGRLLDRVADAVLSFYESRGFDRVDAGTVELAGETVEEYTYERSLT
ncbi:GNAT family N-acetyltransferase [Halobacteriales archaeon QS_1_69_70]|nr:MAG: GNAT family N-acetyltransferase [Halobacteriales archaeon QS_1_69_70]